MHPTPDLTCVICEHRLLFGASDSAVWSEHGAASPNFELAAQGVFCELELTNTLTQPFNLRGSTAALLLLRNKLLPALRCSLAGRTGQLGLLASCLRRRWCWLLSCRLPLLRTEFPISIN